MVRFSLQQCRYFGVVPIENSTEGTVNNTLDMFVTSPLKICGDRAENQSSSNRENG